MSRSTRLLSSSPYYRDYDNQLVDDFGTIVPPNAEQEHAARLYVCGQAVDAEDARDLLSKLGLLEEPA